MTSNTLTVEEYTGDTIIDNHFEVVKIGVLKCPLANIPPGIKTIVVNNCFNVYRSEHVLPHDCVLLVQNMIITKLDVLDRITQNDVSINTQELTEIPEKVYKLKNLKSL
jgi:hypothetical protein